MFGDAERDPADEGGDEAVAERDVGEPEGEESEPDRVDALVAPRDPAGDDVVEPPAEEPDSDPDHDAEARLAEQLEGLLAGVAARGREDEEEEHERQREPVVETRFQVQGVADLRRHPLRGNDRGCDHGIGRRKTAPSRNASAQLKSGKTASRTPPAGRS